MAKARKMSSRGNAAINIVGAALLLLYSLFKIIDISVPLRDVPVIIFFGLWILSLHWRIVNKRTRKYLMFIASLELFWFLTRSVKFALPKGGYLTVARYAWYLYYLPMLMIPAFCLLLSISMGKAENVRPRRFLIIFPIISAALFVLVISNDLHNAVFRIPPGPDGIEVGFYTYGAGFFTVMTYIWLCVVASIGIIIVKCRFPSRRLSRILPIIPLAFIAVICILNIMRITRYFGVYKIDITLDTCICATATLEMCVQNGLIPSNSRYDELFRISGARAVITDAEGKALISSDTCDEISEENIRKARTSPVLLDNGMRLSSVPIKRGRVLWQDDLTELNRVLAQLSETNDYLQGKNAAVRQAYAYKKRERQLIEKNRLYNRVLTQTWTEIERYSELVEQLAAETDRERAKALAVKTAFVSAFIKRRDNLIFLSEQGQRIDPSELSYCIEESLSNLRLGGMDCECSCELTEPLEFEKISALYECFYLVIYGIIDDISAAFVYLIEENGEAGIEMRVTAKNGADLSDRLTSKNGINAESCGEEWTVSICG